MIPLRVFRFIIATAFASITIMVGGCSSFESTWQAALKTPASLTDDAPNPTAERLAPAWQGTWHSIPSNHEGPLRCVVTPIAAADNTDGSHYAFHFHAYWGLNFPAEYTIEMTVKSTDGHITFEGEQDLGVLAGGVYRCEGHIEGDQFKATYRSKHDHGTFEMTKAIAQP